MRKMRIDHPISQMKQAGLFLIPAILCCGLLAMCAITFYRTTPMYVESRVRKMAATLPRPERTELILEAIKNTSGSDCIGFTYYGVYGTNEPLEEVIELYRKALLDAGWEDGNIEKDKLAPQFRELILGAFHKEGYLLQIRHVGLHEAISRTGAYEHKEVLESQAERFKVLFMIVLPFYVCPWWE